LDINFFYLIYFVGEIHQQSLSSNHDFLGFFCVTLTISIDSMKVNKHLY